MAVMADPMGRGFCGESPRRNFEDLRLREKGSDESGVLRACVGGSLGWGTGRYPRARGPDQVLESTMRSNNRMDL